MVQHDAMGAGDAFALVQHEQIIGQTLDAATQLLIGYSPHHRTEAASQIARHRRTELHVVEHHRLLAGDRRLAELGLGPEPADVLVDLQPVN